MKFDSHPPLVVLILLIVFGAFLAALDSARSAPDGAFDSGGEIDLARPARLWLAGGVNGFSPVVPASGLLDLPPRQMGWFDYDIEVDRTGWHRLVAKAPKGLGPVRFRILATGRKTATNFDGLQMVSVDWFATGWAWLPAGTHRLRIENTVWTGFPPIQRLGLQAWVRGRPHPFHLLPRTETVFRSGECEPLKIEAGGTGSPYELSVGFTRDGTSLPGRSVAVPASAAPEMVTVAIPCDAAGDATADIAASGEGAAAGPPHRTRYTVVDTQPVRAAISRGALVQDIDAVQRAPDYSSCDTAVVDAAGGAYRQSGDHGTTPFIRSPGQRPPGCWFAYRIQGLEPGQPYLFEIEYPDDQARVFVAAVRDAATRAYPTGIGVETGGIWPLGGGSGVASAIFWPGSRDARAIVINIHDKMTAAASHIRIYQAQIRLPARTARDAGRRDVSLWYEEGENFRSLGGQSDAPGAIFTPVDRYMMLASDAGVTSISPTAAIYGFVLYPSAYNASFQSNRDTLAAMLLSAERYGMTVVPELYPRADELLWPPRTAADAQRRLLLSKDGLRHATAADGPLLRPPYYNILDEDVRRWYVDMAGELADRYARYPALAGIRLRVLPWKNAALNNLVSLDWGYNADIVTRFFRETRTAYPAGLDLVSDSPAAARARHAVLTGPLREAWIAWRCAKIADLYREIAARIGRARAGLELYVSLFQLADGDALASAEPFRLAGLDPAVLRRVPGLHIVDARFRYGAREADRGWRQRWRQAPATPANLALMANADGRPQLLMSMEYLEITGKAVPGSSLGLPAGAGDPWISAASVPPGRLAVERLARAVAVGDPMSIGDGGNGYVYGNADTRAFLATFACLPARPFARRSDIPPPLAIRESRELFYVVNMGDRPVSARIHITGSGRVMNACSPKPAIAAPGGIRLELAPYELAAFRMGNRQRLTGVELSAP